jgi:hypothetical protein
MLIRNVKSKKDRDAKLKEQRENLGLALKNDATISAARKQSALGIMDAPTSGQIASNQEITEDDTATTVRARDNLLRFFSLEKTRAILQGLSMNQIRNMNIFWNDISTDLKGTEPRLVTPSVFKRITETKIARSLGERIREPQGEPRGEPRPAEEPRPPRPPRGEPAEEPVKRADLGADTQRQKAATDKKREEAGAAAYTEEPVSQKKRFENVQFGAYDLIYGNQLTDDEKKRVNRLEPKIKDKDSRVRRAMAIDQIYFSIKDDDEKERRFGILREYEREMEKRAAVYDAEERGKYERGRKTKRGRGVNVIDPSPRWIHIGKLKYNKRALDEKQMLSIKYPSGAMNPYFRKSIPVSDNLHELIQTLETTKKLDKRLMKELDPDERKLMETFLVRAGVGRGFGILKVTPTDEEAEKEKRLELLRGSYMAGNNSKELIQELRSLILYFIKIGRMKRSEGLATLVELV